MNHLSFRRDFAYKFIKSTSFINYHETPKIILPLWRSNRLSLIRGYIFLMSFFKYVALKKTSTVRVKYKRSDKKTYKKTVFYFHIYIKDTDFFIFILNYLPEPKLFSTISGYVLIYPYHHFVIRIYCNIKEPIFVYRIIPYIKLLANAKIYKDSSR